MLDSAYLQLQDLMDEDEADCSAAEGVAMQDGFARCDPRKTDTRRGTQVVVVMRRELRVRLRRASRESVASRPTAIGCGSDVRSFSLFARQG